LGADAEYHEWQNQMTIRLTKKDIEKIPTVFFFRQGDTINVFQKSGQVKKHMIYDSESATAMLKNLTADTKKGRYSGFEFIDYVGGILRVSHTEGRIEATYTNSSSNYLKMIAQKLE
jgi:hypothetical protein